MIQKLAETNEIENIKFGKIDIVKNEVPNYTQPPILGLFFSDYKKQPVFYSGSGSIETLRDFLSKNLLKETVGTDL